MGFLDSHDVQFIGLEIPTSGHPFSSNSRCFAHCKSPLETLQPFDLIEFHYCHFGVMIVEASTVSPSRETGLRPNGISSNRQNGIRSNGIRSKENHLENKM